MALSPLRQSPALRTLVLMRSCDNCGRIVCDTPADGVGIGARAPQTHEEHSAASAAFLKAALAIDVRVHHATLQTSAFEPLWPLEDHVGMLSMCRTLVPFRQRDRHT